MSVSDDLPLPSPSFGAGAPSWETFGERLRRRREASTEGRDVGDVSPWQARVRTLTAMLVGSPHHSAGIVRSNSVEAKQIPGIETILFADDIPAFRNSLGPGFSGEPLLAESEVNYRGQAVALIIGRDESCCREAAAVLEVDYHPQPAILTIDHAVAMESFHESPRVCERGDVSAHIHAGPRHLTGSFVIPPQQPLRSGTTEVRVTPDFEGRRFSVKVRALSPTLVRAAVARAAGISESDVQLEPVPLVGITDALEWEPARLAMLTTRAAIACGSPVVLRVSEAESSLVRGQRHPVKVTFDVAFDDDGRVQALDLKLNLDGGYYATDSATILDRASLHADSVYAIPNIRITSQLCRTHRIVSSSLPAEGAAQGAWAIEEIMRRIAAEVGKSAHLVRESNFYQEGGKTRTVPCGQPILASAIHRAWNQVLRLGNYGQRVVTIAKWNRRNASCKRGLAVVPAKFGLGDPRTERAAASALVQILTDGSVIIRIGLVDANDGLDEALRREVSQILGIDPLSVHVIPNDFDIFPIATPLVGSDATGLVRRAIRDACQPLVERLTEVARELFAARGQADLAAEDLIFRDGIVGQEVSPSSPIHFREVVEAAWNKRISLVSHGHYRTPNLWWDHELGAGWPFSSFTYGAAVAEVQIDAFTGEVEILRVDLVCEGSSSPHSVTRDLAQASRAFTLGTGWVLSENCPYPETDALAATRGDKFPAMSLPSSPSGFADAPFEFRAERLATLADPESAPGDPCSEAPLLLAFSVREAIWDALRAFGWKSDQEIELPFPSQPPSVLATLRSISRKLVPPPTEIVEVVEEKESENEE